MCSVVSGRSAVLVAVIWTIRMAVAPVDVLDAHVPGGAFELVRRAFPLAIKLVFCPGAVVESVTDRVRRYARAIPAGEVRGRARGQTAFPLIRAVRALVHPVALQHVADAAAVRAAKLGGSATALDLIFAVATIGDSVATLVDT